MGTSNNIDPHGRFALRAQLVTKVSELDTTIAGYVVGPGRDHQGLSDLIRLRADHNRRIAALEST